MPTTSKTVPTIGVLLLAVALSGCGDGESGSGTASSDPPTTTAARTPTATVTDTSASGALTDAEILWLGQFNRTAGTLIDALGKGDTDVTSPAEMRKDAESQRACGRALDGMKDPGPRLQSVYRAFTDACAHFDRAADCGLTVARYMTGVVPGSPEDRKLNEASDCYGAEVSKGAQKLTDAYTASLSLLADVPST